MITQLLSVTESYRVTYSKNKIHRGYRGIDVHTHKVTELYFNKVYRAEKYEIMFKPKSLTLHSQNGLYTHCRHKRKSNKRVLRSHSVIVKFCISLVLQPVIR